MERERERERETETERETDREKHFELIYRQAKCELQGYVAVWTVERVQCGCNSNLWGDCSTLGWIVLGRNSSCP